MRIWLSKQVPSPSLALLYNLFSYIFSKFNFICHGFWKLNDSVLQEEVKFWTNPTLRGYPNLVKLIGYTWERDAKGLVYDLNPLDTLDNVIMKGIKLLITSLQALMFITFKCQRLREKFKTRFNWRRNVRISNVLLPFHCCWMICMGTNP